MGETLISRSPIPQASCFLIHQHSAPPFSTFSARGEPVVGESQSATNGSKSRVRSEDSRWGEERFRFQVCVSKVRCLSSIMGAPMSSQEKCCCRLVRAPAATH